MIFAKRSSKRSFSEGLARLAPQVLVDPMRGLFPVPAGTNEHIGTGLAIARGKDAGTGGLEGLLVHQYGPPLRRLHPEALLQERQVYRLAYGRDEDVRLDHELGAG